MVTTPRLKVLQTVKDGHSGHLAIHARIVEQDGDTTVEGAVETYGIDPLALDVLYKGDVGKWRDDIARIMLDNHRRRTKAHDSLVDWQDKEFEITP